MIEQTSKEAALTQEQAQRLGSYVLDAGMDAHIIPIERGDQYVVRILQPQWHCWSFEDWTQFCKELKHQKKKQRQADRAQRAIDPSEIFSLAI
jgi:hypothetical protein